MSSPDSLPLDTRLLSNAVIEMNISRRTVALYPGKHALVEKSLERAFRILQELFELRSEITLAVAKDTLVVDKYRLDTKNPVFRDFALSLSGRGIACLTFVKGITMEELFSFQRFLTAEHSSLSAASLPEILNDYELRHILVRPVDYGEFGFVRDTVSEDGPDEYLLERYIKGLTEGTLLPGEFAEAVDGLPPEVLARLLSTTMSPDAGEETYEHVISGYLRRSGTPVFSGKDLGRLLTFMSGLSPELKRQFLGTSVRIMGRDQDALRAALDGMSVDSVIEFLESLEKNRVVIPDAVRNILSKFSHLGEHIIVPDTDIVENLADDILLSGDMMNILRSEESRSVMTDSYRQEMKEITKGTVTGLGGKTTGTLQAEFQNDYIRYCYERVFLEAIEAKPDASDLVEERAYAEIASRLADEMVDAGQYGQLHELIATMHDYLESKTRPSLAGTFLGHCRSEPFIKRLAASFETCDRRERGAAMLLCIHYGEEIVPSLYDLLSSAASAATRKFLISILVRLGDRVVAESRRRLADRRWYVRRNILYILGESGSAASVPTLRALSGDKDPRVQLEVAKCLVKTGSSEGVEILRNLINGGQEEVRAAAVAYAGSEKVAELLPDLVGILQSRKILAGDFPVRMAVVRALGRMGLPEAEKPLRKILSEHTLLYRGQLERLKQEVRKALSAIGRQSA